MKSVTYIEFENEYDLTDAVKEMRSSGYEINDVYSPYAIHGFDKTLGLNPSRLTKVCFGFAFFGLFLALWLEYWLSAVDWPINVGGRAWNSFPAFMPIAFEVMVLFSGLGSVFSFFLWRKLKMKNSKQPHLRTTNDRFYCELFNDKQRMSIDRLNDIAQKYHGKIMEEQWI